LASAMELSPAVREFAGSHPQTMVLIASAINLVCRHFTSGPVHYLRKPCTQKTVSPSPSTGD
jgi:hypothetical protein